MSYSRVLAILFSLIVTSPSHAAEPDTKKEPPRIAMCLPMSIPIGETTKVVVRGWNLEGVKVLRTSDTQITFKVLSTAKAEVPNGLDAKHVGDTQIEVEATVSRESKPGTVELVATGPEGDSRPHIVLVGSESPLSTDKEANDGFRQAQSVTVPQTVDGVIHDKRNVDVFGFEVDTQQRVVIEVLARRHGSALDSLLTLFDERGNIVAVNDDHDDSPDSRITGALRPGKYVISLQDAHDQGGPTHPYRLILRTASSSQDPPR